MNNKIDLTLFEEHTPGPWRYEIPLEEGMMIMAGELTMVAELSHLMTNMSPETDDVNPTGLDPDAVDARLILASPDLLAELKKMYEREDALVSAIKELCDSEDSTGCSGDLTVVSLDPMLKLYELTSE